MIQKNARMQDFENKPRISNWIGLAYLLLAVILGGVFLIIATRTVHYQTLAKSIAIAILMLIFIFVVTLVVSFYKTIYKVNQGYLKSWSPLITINIKIEDISKIEKIIMPFYFKGYGASFYCGKFYIPSLGWTNTVITNLTDAVLIIDNEGKKYLISPSKPEEFVEMIKKIKYK